MKTPFDAINYIFETYASNIEQLETALKDNEKYEKKHSKQAEIDYNITLSVLGKSLTKQFMSAGNAGTYAPLYLSMSRITLSDLQALFTKFIADEETLYNCTNKVVGLIKKSYPKKQFDFYGDQWVTTNIVFQTFAEFCAFIRIVQEAVYKGVKNIPDSYMNWKPLIKKLKNML